MRIVGRKEGEGAMEKKEMQKNTTLDQTWLLRLSFGSYLPLVMMDGTRPSLVIAPAWGIVNVNLSLCLVICLDIDPTRSRWRIDAFRF